jgi:hypothetical protein
MAWLIRLSALLERTQLPDGSWDQSWSHVYDREAQLLYDDPVLDRLAVTGHHLEWIALAPASVRPSQASVAHAVAAFAESLDKLPPMSIRSFKTLLGVTRKSRYAACA